MADEQTHDVDALLRKNSELLSELKTQKARVADLEKERDAAQVDATEQAARLRDLAVERPVEQAIGGLFSLPWRHAKATVADHFTFDLTDDGDLAVTEKETGEAVPIDGIGTRMQSIPDLAVLLKPATGGGAKGSDGTHQAAPPAPAETRVESRFGLR